MPPRHAAPAPTAVGICVGASTISVARVERLAGASVHVIHHGAYPHRGDPRGALCRVVEGLSLGTGEAVAVTGRKFRRLVRLTSIPEPEAVEVAYRVTRPPGVACPAVVSAGGETFMAYILDATGRIKNVVTGNKCASGTGEFFLQQVTRMGASLEEASSWAACGQAHPVSGRCSVFCKSDCTHALNKGVPRAEVAAGLCRMMAAKVMELLKRVPRRDVMLVGGTALNATMVAMLREQVPSLLVPPAAPYFEALGAAVWALDHATDPFPGVDHLFLPDRATLDRLPALRLAEPQVEFRPAARGEVRPGDTCVLGLDVGSTTTKAVLVRVSDASILASVYLRTHGDPVAASRGCYRAILEQVAARAEPSSVAITGLGVTGSGRQVAGLHAQTDGVINEIMAHATAAAHVDPEVETILELGGQDAKYTHLHLGVPCDYAMNEACSAGTGSFLEEAAQETLGVAMEEIAGIALRGENPPNFNDQCAAFIASDVKNAVHEGVSHDDVVAGLVYSVCMNYANRVKGSRPVGKKVFMQGGVCYNRAVPLAMASLLGTRVVVPPDPGLMGAWGAALEVCKRLQAGWLAPGTFDLRTLADREVERGPSFTCKGGREGCDRKCQVARLRIAGKTYPFGGACNLYENLRRHRVVDVEALDLVRARQALVMAVPPVATPHRGRVGTNRSFLVHTYHPLYATFFAALGYTLVLPSEPSARGVERRGAAFCFPGELSHGFFHALLSLEDPPGTLFLPHFKAVPTAPGQTMSQVCPLVQGEPSYLRSAFREEIAALEARGVRVVSPRVDLSRGLRSGMRTLVEEVVGWGVPAAEARRALEAAVGAQEAVAARTAGLGREALAALERDPSQVGVVVFARSYNGFVEEAHKGIPHKLASRGVRVIPYDALPMAGEPTRRHMYWGTGEAMLRAAHVVARHPQLFGLFVTNFSCGPDSFLVTYFREAMGRKPSLTLELDSHTADAGLETRVEAFLDIAGAHRRMEATAPAVTTQTPFTPARTEVRGGKLHVVTSNREVLPVTDPRVKVAVPSMGVYFTQALAASFRGAGINAVSCAPADDRVLKLGRANTLCKECLPLILTTGTLLDQVESHQRPGEVLVYFMPTGSGPCRFGQYYVFMEDLVARRRIRDVALLSLSSENGYAGLGTGFELDAWKGVLAADVVDDLRSMLMANAVDVPGALAELEHAWQGITRALETGSLRSLRAQLATSATRLKQLPRKRPLEEVPVVSLQGEIFVRKDGLSRRHLTERLAERGFATTCAPISEWIVYADWLLDHGLADHTMGLGERLRLRLKQAVMRHVERTIKRGVAASGWLRPHGLDVDAVVRRGADHISPDLAGEAILTVGSALTEVASRACGVIAVGPFGCMPNRLAESVLSQAMTREEKLRPRGRHGALVQVLSGVEELPFLAIESDGSPFPQVVEARLEAFCLQAARLHARMVSAT